MGSRRRGDASSFQKCDQKVCIGKMISRGRVVCEEEGSGRNEARMRPCCRRRLCTNSHLHYKREVMPEYEICDGRLPVTYSPPRICWHRVKEVASDSILLVERAVRIYYFAKGRTMIVVRYSLLGIAIAFVGAASGFVLPSPLAYY